MKPPRPQVAKSCPRGACRATLSGMEILLNGQPCRTRDGATLDDLLHERGLAERRVAIEVNGEIVPRSRYADTPLVDGDRLEIVVAVGGG